MAVTFTDGRVRFDSGWECVLWVFVLPFVVGAVMGFVYPALGRPIAYLFIHAVVAIFRLIKSLLVLPAPAALGWA